MPDHAVIWWFTDHAAGVSSAVFALVCLGWWWRWRRPREPKSSEISPMSARWLTAKDRFKAPHRD